VKQEKKPAKPAEGEATTATETIAPTEVAAELATEVSAPATPVTEAVAETSAPAEVVAAPVVEAVPAPVVEANPPTHKIIWRRRRNYFVAPQPRKPTRRTAPGFSFLARASDRNSPLRHPAIHCFP